MTRPFQLDEAKRLAALHELDLLHAPAAQAIFREAGFDAPPR